MDAWQFCKLQFRLEFAKLIWTMALQEAYLLKLQWRVQMLDSILQRPIAFCHHMQSPHLPILESLQHQSCSKFVYYLGECLYLSTIYAASITFCQHCNAETIKYHTIWQYLAERLWDAASGKMNWIWSAPPMFHKRQIQGQENTLNNDIPVGRPNCPKALLPQVKTLPLSCRATEWKLPATSCITWQVKMIYRNIHWVLSIMRTLSTTTIKLQPSMSICSHYT